MTPALIECPCERCAREVSQSQNRTFWRERMYVCEHCGNKRCPHATDHRNACTNSNVPGQPGSAYA